MQLHEQIVLELNCIHMYMYLNSIHVHVIVIYNEQLMFLVLINHVGNEILLEMLFLIRVAHHIIADCVISGIWEELIIRQIGYRERELLTKFPAN